MTLRLPLLLAGAALMLAAYCIVQVNRVDRESDATALRAELDAILAYQGVATLPMADPPGQIIDAAVRFRPPGCATDAYILPLGQGLQPDVYAVRFTELSGALYTPRIFHVDGTRSRSGVIASQVQRNLRQLAAAFGRGTVRNGHMVLTVFLPNTCQDGALPNLDGFWSPQPQQT